MARDPEADGPRPAHRAEFDETLALIDTVFRHDAGLAPTMGPEFPLLLTPANVDNLLITRVGGAVVSHAGVYDQALVTAGARLPVACIGAVCTTSAHRGRGYAGALMDLAADRARAAGNVLLLISGDRPLYLGRGAARIASVYKGVLAPRHDVSTKGVRAYRPADLPAVSALHDDEPEPRYAWEPDRLAPFLATHMDTGARTWVHALDDGTIDGALVAWVGPPRWEGAPGEGRVIQLLGERGVARMLCAAAMRELSLERLHVDALHAEIGLRERFRTLGAVLTPAPTEWTVKVLDLERLLALCRLDRAAGARLAADGERLVAIAGGATVPLDDPHDRAALLFNESAHWPEAVRQQPEDIRHALAEILPVPLCSYGINYI